MVKNSILKQVMDQNAFARLSNIAAVNPTKGNQFYIYSVVNRLLDRYKIVNVNGCLANAVENLIVRMARSGQLNGKLSDEGLKQLLDKVAGQQKTTTVKVSSFTQAHYIIVVPTNFQFDRRRAELDDSDEEDY